jgi:acetyltransferase-like isoleucine patch superfamily enzyme
MGALGKAAGVVLLTSSTARERARRARFVANVRRAAWQVGAEVELDLPPDLLVGKDVTVQVEPGSRNRLVLGPGSRIDDRALLMLKGGSVLGGPRIEVRRDVVLNVAGTLRLDGDNPLSWGTVVHCSSDVHLEPMAGIAEHVTIADSSHFFTTPDEHFWHNVRTGSVRVGRNTWVCPKATLTRGADVGSHCIVASNSVVTGPVPDGHLASGVPARTTPLPLPWATPDRR